VTLAKDSFTRDLAMYRYFLQRNWVWENYSLNREAELNFVQSHMQQNAGTGALSQYCSSDPKKIAIWLRVIDAKGLCPKDLNGVNNPYFTVTFNGLTWTGPIRKSTLNPVFDFSVPLLCHQQQDSSLTITLWNRSSVHFQRQDGPKKDAFLGCVSFSTFEMLGICGAEAKYYLLQKRSKKSHATGTIGIQLRELSKDRLTLESLFGNGLRFVPSDPENKFWDLVRAVYQWEFRKMQQPKLTSPSESLLAAVSSIWRIRKTFESICKLDVAMELYSTDDIPIEILYSHFLDALERISEADNATTYEIQLFGSVCTGMVETLNSVLATFFHIKRKHSTGKQLEIITFILGGIYSSPILAFPSCDLLSQVRNQLIDSIHTRYQALETDSKKYPESERLPVVFLVESIREDLVDFHGKMDVILCG
jgi:hypothetical protein